MRLTTSTPHKNWRNCPAIPCNKPTRRATASAAGIPTAADVPPANTAPKNKTAAGGSLTPAATAACTSPSSAYTTAKPQAAAPPTKKIPKPCRLGEPNHRPTAGARLQRRGLLEQHHRNPRRPPPLQLLRLHRTDGEIPRRAQSPRRLSGQSGLARLPQRHRSRLRPAL